jgi:hypothetical protein
MTLDQLQTFADNAKRAIELTLANAITTKDVEIMNLRNQVESLETEKSRT